MYYAETYTNEDGTVDYGRFMTEMATEYESKEILRKTDTAGNTVYEIELTQQDDENIYRAWNGMTADDKYTFTVTEKKDGEDGLPIPPYAVYNIGNSNPENLLDFVTILQEELIRAGVLPEDYDFESHKELVPMQAGDVPITYADTSQLEKDFGFKPKTELRDGLRNFAEWYKEFYKV